jgi:hypothetical protein
MLITLLTLLSLTAQAESLQSIFDLGSITSKIESGEYYRDGFACKLVVAQDEEEIFVQIFDNPNHTQYCKDQGLSMTFKAVAGKKNLYSSITSHANGSEAFLRTVGSDAIFLGTTESMVISGNAYLYVKR